MEWISGGETLREYHAQRIATETEIKSALRDLNKDQQLRLMELLGTPPSMGNVPQSFWNEIEQEHAAMLFLLIVSVSGRSARHNRSRLQTTGLFVRDEEIDRRVATYAAERASKVSKGYVSGIKNRLKKHLSDLERFAKKKVKDEEEQRENEFEEKERPEKLDPDEAAEEKKKRRKEIEDRINAAESNIEDVTEEDLSNVFGSDNTLDIVARTETTAAVTNGEGIIRDDAKAQGKDVKVIWRLDPALQNCPLCIEVANTEEAFWVRKYPNGPPIHPKCGCDLETIVDGISTGSFLPDVGINPVQKIWVPKNWNPKIWTPNLVS